MECDMFAYDYHEVPSAQYPVLSLGDASSQATAIFKDNPELIGFAPNTAAARMFAQATLVQLLGPDFNGSPVMFSSYDEMDDAQNEIAVGVRLSADSTGTDGQDFTILYHELGPYKDDYDGYPKPTNEEFSLTAGLIALQAAASEALLGCNSDSLNGCPDIIIRTQEFPRHSYNKVENDLKYLLPLWFGALFMMMGQAVMIQSATEIERGIKDALAMKGMARPIYWLSWLFAQCTVGMIAVIIAECVSFALGIFEHSDPFWIFFVLALLMINTVIFCLFMVSLFGKSVQAKKLFLVGIILLIAVQGGYMLVQFFMIDKDWPFAMIRLTFFFYVIPACHLIYTNSDAEVQEISYKHDMSPHTDWCYFFLLFDAFFFLTLIFIIDDYQNDPGFGWMKLLNYFNPFAYCGGQKIQPKLEDHERESIHQSQNGGIVIDKLEKKFGSFTAVKWTEKKSIDPNQCFCLLGQNGAGKTTTIKMLVGAIEPTTGKAWVDGLDVVRDRDTLRQSIGVCPQFDVLYDELTCLDHLLLYGKMAGMDHEEAEKKGRELLRDMNLADKTDVPSGMMSGGQQRRLTLMTALIGNPRVVMLDEPTTGLDPENRRRVWAVLQRTKKTATMLLTTHAMEEADGLGDITAIMAAGKLKAFGTNLYLKKKYGLGYRFHCVPTSAGLNSDRLKTLLTKHVKGYKVLQDKGSEFSFAVPLDQQAKFPKFFDELEREQKSLGLESFGLSMTTLEEVFLSVIKRHELNLEEERKKRASYMRPDEKTAFLDEEQSSIPPFDLNPSGWQQFTAVLGQVLTTSKRNPFGLIVLILFPIVFTCLAGGLSVILKEDDPSSKYMVASSLGDESFLCPYSTNSTSNIDPDTLNSVLGPFKGVYFSDPADLYINVNQSGDGHYPDYVGAFIFNDLDPANLKVDVSILFNQKTTYSLRVLMGQIYRSVGSQAAIDEITCSFQQWPPPAQINDFSKGGLMYFVAVTFGLLTSFYAEEMIRLRVKKVRQMLLLAGLSKPAFWLSYFLVHLMLFYCSCILSVVVMFAFGMDGPTKNNPLCYMFLFTSFGCAAICCGYFMSFIFETSEQAQQWVSQMVNITMFIPWLIVGFAVDNPSTALENCLTIVPGFGLYRGLALLETVPGNGLEFSASDVFKWDKILIQICLILLADAFGYACIVGILHSGILSAVAESFKPKSSQIQPSGRRSSGEESKCSGILEKDGIRTTKEENKIHAENVVKHYDLGSRGTLKAVQGVSLGVESGIIFGLLGPNGAGKTSVIKCMTGTQTMDSGEAWINNFSIKTEITAARKQMGICPQFDALLDFLSAREHLRMFAKIRGVPGEEIERAVDNILTRLDLQLKADIPCKDYSGGNRRKLSVALAMIASSCAVFLDEPSTGMDPSTRQFLWSFLHNEAHSRAMVLTTHSMEEADALCRRIGIMVKGRLRTMGTSQQLKNRHGTNYQVRLRIKDPKNTSKVDDLIKSLSADTNPDDEEEGYVLRTYQVPLKDCKLTDIFAAILKHQKEYTIIDFTVSQATLEDVFIKFARIQNDNKPLIIQTTN